MPCKSRSSSTQDTVEDVLTSLSYLCHTSDFDDIAVGGNFNTCLNDSEHPMTKEILSFTKEEILLFLVMLKMV